MDILRVVNQDVKGFENSVQKLRQSEFTKQFIIECCYCYSQLSVLTDCFHSSLQHMQNFGEWIDYRVIKYAQQLKKFF